MKESRLPGEFHIRLRYSEKVCVSLFPQSNPIKKNKRNKEIEKTGSNLNPGVDIFLEQWMTTIRGSKNFLDLKNIWREVILWDYDSGKMENHTNFNREQTGKKYQNLGDDPRWEKCSKMQNIQVVPRACASAIEGAGEKDSRSWNNKHCNFSCKSINFVKNWWQQQKKDHKS